jgi:chemotaxis protein methyltransferase CheR
MRANNVSSYNEYLNFLSKHPDEYTKLADALTINVTKFLRNYESFEIIGNEIIPNIFKHKEEQGRRIVRLWSAGCSSGEEPYTLAILIDRFLKDKIRNFHLKIYGTDIDDDSLQRARTGSYDEMSLSETPKEIVAEYFVRQGEKYSIIDRIKRMVAFQKNDLIHGEKLNSLDLITCRNVLIYFSRKLQEDLFKSFYEQLNDGGYLVLGKTETLMGEYSNLFLRINAKERIFQKPFR